VLGEQLFLRIKLQNVVVKVELEHIVANVLSTLFERARWQVGKFST